MGTNKTKHTPGPWERDISLPREIWAKTRKSRPVAVIESEREYHPDGWSEEDFANAQLISAAPELLAACEKAESVIDNLLDYAVDVLENNKIVFHYKDGKVESTIESARNAIKTLASALAQARGE